MKSILLIGVGEIGLNQIKWAREAGFMVIATDLNPDAPALKLADLGVNISGTDTRALVSWALENQEKHGISAVYSGNDLGVFSAVAVANALGIEYLSLASVTRGLSKSLMKTCWTNDGVLTPAYEFTGSRADADKIINKFGLPVIIKPLDSSGSQGIQILRDPGEIGQAYAEAWKFTHSNQIIIEEFIDGRHIDGNAFFWDGKFYACGLSERIFSPAPYRVPVGGYEPVDFTPTERSDIFEAFEQATRSLGITHGPVKGDFILSDQGLQIIEISPRFHGDVGTSHITKYRAGSSHLQVYFETLVTGEVPEEKLDRIINTERVCGWRVFDLEPGKIVNLDEAANQAKAEVEVANVFVRPRGPKEISGLRNNNNVAGFVWVVGDSRAEVDEVLADYLAALKAKVVYEQ